MPGPGALGEFALEEVRNAAGEFDHLEAALDVALGVGERLAVLGGEQPGEAVVLLLCQVEEFEQDAGAALRVGGRPADLRRLRDSDGVLGLGMLGQRHLGLHLAGIGIEHVAETTRCPFDLFPADEVTDLTHDVLPAISAPRCGGAGWSDTDVYMPLFAAMVTGRRALIFARQSAYTGIRRDLTGAAISAEGLLIMTIAPPAAGACRLSAILAGVALMLVASAHATPARAENAALLEQDSGGAQAKSYVGAVTWSVEKEPPVAGAKPSLAVRGDIVIPERHMAVTWVLHRNTDRSLPATHTIDIMFKLPPDFPGHGVANVAGIMLKPNDRVRGTALAGLVAKVTDSYYLFGLSAIEGDAKLNVDLLRDGKSLDILIIYGNGTRAILTVDKGASGDQAFKEAFTAWEK